MSQLDRLKLQLKDKREISYALSRTELQVQNAWLFVECDRLIKALELAVTQRDLILRCYSKRASHEIHIGNSEIAEILEVQG